MGDIVTSIFSGFTTTITNFAQGLKSAFEHVLYEDPTAATKVLSPLAQFGFVLFGITLALGLVHLVVRLIRR